MKELLLKRKTAFAIYVFACFFPVVTDLLSSWSFSLLIGSIEKKSLSYFYYTLMVCLVITVLGIVLFIVSRFLRIGFMRDTILDVRMNAFNRILSLDFETFSKQSKEVYISNLINDVNTFERDFFLKLINIIFQGGKYITFVLILLFLDPYFGLGTILISLSVYWISNRFEARTVRMAKDISTESEVFTTEVANTFNGLEILKLNQVEHVFLDKTLNAIDRLERRKLRLSVFTESQRGLTRFLSNLIFIGMMVYLLFLVRQGSSLTKIAFMLQLGGGCIWPIGYVIPMFNEFKASVAIYEKITQQETNRQVDSISDSPFTFNDALSAANLSYQYDRNPVFTQATFEINPGEKVLIKGASGSGKTTLLHLLSRTLNEPSGALTLDQKPLKDLNATEFFSHVAFIYQDVFLFEDSIINNITLYKPLDEAHLNWCVEKSGLSEWVSTLSDGLHHALTENGKNLSGGQRQRIAIARALYKRAEILFVDEATSSLNETLGRDVEATLLNLNTTVIAISHRYYPGLTNRYDKVIEIKNRRVCTFPAPLYFTEEEAIS